MNPQPDIPPNHSLLGSNLPPDSEPPKIYAVADLRAYVKAPMGEELGSPAGASAPPATPGKEVVCACVPVGDCACNVVEYSVGSQACPTYCPCTDTCSCTGDFCFPHGCNCMFIWCACAFDWGPL